MDFDLDDLISSDAANNAKVSTKFQPKAKPTPKHKTQPGPKSAPIPLTQSAEAATAVNNEFKGRSEEEHPGNNVNQISGNINDNWQSSFEKSQGENVQSFLPLESVNDFLPQSTTVAEFSESLHEMGSCLLERTTVDADDESEAPTIDASMDGNLRKGLIEPELSNNIEACTNLESLAQLDPLTGEEAAIFNDNGDFQIGNVTSGSKINNFWNMANFRKQKSPLFGNLLTFCPSQKLVQDQGLANSSQSPKHKLVKWNRLLPFLIRM